MPEKRALLICVSGYAAPTRDLDFAVPPVQRLARILQDHYEYEVTTVVEPGLRSADIDAHVRRAIIDANAQARLLVLIVAHGRSTDSQHLHALGIDQSLAAEVGSWLHLVQNRQGPMTLFLLDTCESGTAARLSWIGDYAEESLQFSVLSACQAEQSAFDAVFTQACANVLEQIALGSLQVARCGRLLPLSTFAKAVKTEVASLRKRISKWPQHVIAIRADSATDLDARLNFFTHPDVDLPDLLIADGVDSDRLDLPTSADEGLDLPYLLDRAACFGAFADRSDKLAGCFTGRVTELKALATWPNTAAPGPAVIVGGPGAGKSALLSILTCAVHPLLHTATNPLWKHTKHLPPQVQRRLAMVNCHERGLDQITASAGRQLGLRPAPADLLADLAQSAGPCLMIIDSVDKARDQAQVSAWLTETATTTLPTGRPALDLLMASRPDALGGRLRELAETTGLLIDLEAVDSDTLQDDLQHYISRLLRATAETDHSSALFAARTARRLANNSTSSSPFLIAGVHTRRFVEEFGQNAADQGTADQEAEGFGDRVPLTSADLVHAELASQPQNTWDSVVLAVIAHARGGGMPATVITRSAAQLRPGKEPLSQQQLREILRTHGHLLRRSADSTGLMTYQLTDEQLVQHLAPLADRQTIMTALLAPLGPVDARRWHVAEPYLLQHALDHAEGTPTAEELLNDPGFLLYADADVLATASDVSAAAALALVPAPEGPFQQRRQQYALSAMLAGQHDLCARIAHLPDEDPVDWFPLWSLRDDTTAQTWMTAVQHHQRLELAGPQLTEIVEGVSVFVLANQPDLRGLLVVDQENRVLLRYDGRTRVLDSGSTSTITALAISSADAATQVFTGHHDGTVYAVPAANGTPIRLFHDHERRRVRQLASGGTSPPVIAYLTDGGVLGAQSQYQGPHEHQQPRRHLFSVTSQPHAVAVGGSASWTAVVTVNSDTGTANTAATVTVFDFVTFDPVEFPLPWPLHQSHGLAVATLGTRTVILVGSPHGDVAVLDAHTHQTLHTINTGLGRLTDIAVQQSPAGLQCLITGDRGTARAGYLSRAAAFRCQQTSSLPAEAAQLVGDIPHLGADERTHLACHDTGDTIVAIVANSRGRAHCVDLLTGRTMLPALASDGVPVTGLHTQNVSGVPAAVLSTLSGQLLWNLIDGSSGTLEQPARTPTTATTDVTKPSGQPTAPIFTNGTLTTAYGDAQGHVRVGNQNLGRHESPVTALTGARFHGRSTVVSGARDGSVKIWDLATSQLAGHLHMGAPVTAVMQGPHDILLVSAGAHTVAFRPPEREPVPRTANERQGGSGERGQQLRDL
ncbi:caspase family protein [Actinomadura napierensis]|uniref:Peptidase C14 caspase domain-containing protein n=1 Tax=Actinomadura napierensis TaxID=267854 RepID=A0ABN2ZS03_9ACTN